MLGPGTTLGDRYLLHERIASGGMGDVWRAEDSVLGRAVAVKVLLPTLVEEPGFAARFRAEARTMASLNHPGIVDVYDYGHTDGVAYLVMQYVQGEPLSVLLDQLGPLAPGHTMRVVAQAAEALHAAHVHGIVHRDVKPANLLLRPDGRLALGDFGIALSPHAEALTEAGEMMGTASYLAPEQVSGDPVTAATDVYALGVVAYQCLVGRRPFEGDNPLAVAMMQLNDDPPPLPTSIPAGVRMVVLRALAKDPAARWSTAAEMADAARAAGEAWGAGNPVAPAGAHESSLATILGEREPAPRGRGRQVAVLAAMTALLVALAGGATYVLAQPGSFTGGRPAAAAPGSTASADNPAPVVPGDTAPPTAGSSPSTGPTTASPSVRPSATSPGATPSGTPPPPPPGGVVPPPAGPPPQPPPDTRVVPNVIGMLEPDAWQAVVDAGLTPHLEKGKGDKCTVVDQNPVGGTHVAPGTQVTIFVGKLKGQCA